MNRSFCFIFILVLLSACQDPPQDMIFIPGGEFKLGIDAFKELPAFLSDHTTSLNAQPMHKHHVDAFYIDTYEVTYAQFLRFKPQVKYDGGKPREPMRGVDWYEADAYCLWAGKRLPSEFEWEKAARGGDGRLFVWGNEFHREYASLGKSVQPTGSFERDKSPYGVYDMNGNASEWTASPYEPYPNSQYKDANFGKGLKVIRGGSFYKREHGFMKEFMMLTHRNAAPPTIRTWDTGFRCAKSG